MRKDLKFCLITNHHSSGQNNSCSIIVFCLGYLHLPLSLLCKIDILKRAPLHFPLVSEVFDFITSSFLSLFLQKELTEVLRQGMDGMIQFEKKTEKKRRVYTYKEAVERYRTIPNVGHFKRNFRLLVALSVYSAVARYILFPSGFWRQTRLCLNSLCTSCLSEV